MTKVNKRITQIFTLAICIVLSLSLVACKNETPSTEGPGNTINKDIPADVLGFETVFVCYEKGMIGGDETDDLYESRVRVYYLRERLTDTMYVWRTSGRFGNVGGYSYWSSGMTVLMDPATNGPMTYAAFLQYSKEAKMENSMIDSTEGNING